MLRRLLVGLHTELAGIAAIVVPAGSMLVQISQDDLRFSASEVEALVSQFRTENPQTHGNVAIQQFDNKRDLSPGEITDTVKNYHVGEKKRKQSSDFGKKGGDVMKEKEKKRWLPHKEIALQLVKRSPGHYSGSALAAKILKNFKDDIIDPYTRTTLLSKILDDPEIRPKLKSHRKQSGC